MPLIVVERGSDKGKTLVVEPGKTYTFGRENPNASMRIRDALSSRHHFEIRSENGTFVVRDLNSLNGTVLNDEKLAAPAPLNIGDKIQVGETILSFLSDAKEETPAGLVGKTLGGYRILERIGRGGMGTVYKAEQLSLSRVVALKVLSSKLVSDPLFVERFVREAKAAGQLNHPNLVQVFDVGRDRNIYYFSMELMENGSVGDVVSKEGKVPWKRALEMMSDAARGLIFAEQKGIVHRDIKPDNLMLTSQGTVKIGDLGLAKRAEETSEEGGAIFGTPHFIAPEQAQGKDVDHRADLYSLGATFYLVLGGRTPFSGENVKEIVLKQVQEEPVPLPKIVPDLPEEIAAILAKLMKKKPAERYRSAQGLLDDLERVRVMYHLEAHGAVRSARRNRAIAAVLFVAVVALGGVVYYYATKPKETVDRWREHPDPPKDPEVVKPVGPKPEQLAWDAFNPIREDELKLRDRLGGPPEKTWRKPGAEAAWLEVARRYERVGAEYPGTPKGDEAKAVAKRTRDAVDAAKKEFKAAQEAAAAEWAKLLERVDGFAEEGRFSKALVELKSGVDALQKQPESLPAGFATAVKDRSENLVMEASRKAETSVKAAKDAAEAFPGDPGYVRARQELQDFVDRILEVDTAAGNFKDPHDVAKAALDSTLQRALQVTREAFAKDQQSWFRAYLAIRRLAPADGPDPATPFFEYRWEEATQKWKDARAGLRTWIFQDRADAKLGEYARCRHLFETIASRLNARGKDLKDPGFPRSVKQGASMLLDTSPGARPATPEGVPVVQSTGAGIVKKVLEFREMTPRELYEDFLLKGTLWPMSGEEHLDLAVFLSEAGEGSLAVQELSAADMAKPSAVVSPELRAWIGAEVFAHDFFHNTQSSVETAMKEYERVKAGDNERLTEDARRKVETLLDRFESTEKFYVTDFFILNHSERGPEGPVPLFLVPQETSNRFVREFGARPK